MIRRLVDDGFLHYIDRDSEAVTLARPTDNVTAEQLMEIGLYWSMKADPSECRRW